MNHSTLSSSEDNDSKIICDAAAGGADVDLKPCVDGNNNEMQAGCPATSSEDVDELSLTASNATVTTDKSTGEDRMGAIDFKNITGNETRFDRPESRVDPVVAAVNDSSFPLESVETKFKPRWFYRTKSPEISTSTFGGLPGVVKVQPEVKCPFLVEAALLVKSTQAVATLL
jgi:hypothetical protein